MPGDGTAGTVPQEHSPSLVLGRAFADCLFGMPHVCLHGSGILGKGATECFYTDILIWSAALLHWPSMCIVEPFVRGVVELLRHLAC